jgi:hypothetical protein
MRACPQPVRRTHSAESGKVQGLFGGHYGRLQATGNTGVLSIW